MAQSFVQPLDQARTRHQVRAWRGNEEFSRQKWRSRLILSFAEEPTEIVVDYSIDQGGGQT